MTEASQTQPTNERPRYAELFRKLSNEIPLRGSRLFNSGISATLRRLDPRLSFPRRHWFALLSLRAYQAATFAARTRQRHGPLSCKRSP